MLSEISQVLHSQNRNSKINPTRKIYVAFLYIINIYLHTYSNKRKKKDATGKKQFWICYVCDVNTGVVVGLEKIKPGILSIHRRFYGFV